MGFQRNRFSSTTHRAKKDYKDPVGTVQSDGGAGAPKGCQQNGHTGGGNQSHHGRPQTVQYTLQH